MNSKESFLNALQQGIAVLAESEQKDILEEYAQHIELKISGGLTEEEAIQDFGDVHELIGEILEAYHVNPLYADGKGTGTDFGTSAKNLLTRIGHLIYSGAGKTVSLVKRCVQGMGGHLGRAASESVSGEGQWESGSAGAAATRLSRRVGRWLIRLVKAGAWLVWNGVLLLCAIPVVCVGVIGLLLLGMIVVWLTQGMPLAGAFLCCVGLLGTCVGVLGLGKNLVWHWRKDSDSPGNEAAVLEVCTPPEETLTKEEVLDHGKR